MLADEDLAAHAEGDGVLELCAEGQDAGDWLCQA